MANRILLVAAGIISALSVSACGGSDTPAANLNPALAGTWVGTTTITFPGYAPSSYQGQLTIAVSGTNGTVSQLCLDGSGTMTMTGSGNSASWTGTLVCVPVAVTCPSGPGTFSYTLTSTSGVLSSNNRTLTAQSSGTGTLCGTATTVTFSFVGT